MTKEMIEKSIRLLDDLDKIEEFRVKTIDEKNALETMLYAKRDWLDSEESKIV